MYGRSFARYVITTFSRMDSLPDFLTHGAPLARLRELRNKALYMLQGYSQGLIRKIVLAMPYAS